MAINLPLCPTAEIGFNIISGYTYQINKAHYKKSNENRKYFADVYFLCIHIVQVRLEVKVEAEVRVATLKAEHAEQISRNRHREDKRFQEVQHPLSVLK